ncbi:hypothetical protein A2930_04165 [Candidatus Giovannonibacteria bacterium RIFCSPLOWO2_01_FULL_45_34]|uniref:Uncharacterized protein n=1 Tax=Candidatus Giovannonibacteria bacterium RIFCSPLOWO2_01_FULL_45_34 TaxID=1798351 RepID=A0A1F5X1E2_9BACT|nr:MAG: hypothetical protein A3C73_04610 [Candidatus Giovannonibacteria bacterium RIFCSPHIGHO2_02_FULL_44_11]OGF81663.1 MAG: hypothetical protein A2930_04165 [Candidatus Giovannonibacteria bacterium RIFCSPLOWO2_01_FULL_45_34]
MLILLDFSALIKVLLYHEQHKICEYYGFFIIFFGIALIEAFQKQNWLEALLFLALGVLSLWADFKRK